MNFFLRSRKASSACGPPLEPQLVGGEPGQGGGDGAVVPDEPAVEIGRAQESLEASAVRGRWPILHRFNLFRIHPHVSGGYNIPQEVSLSLQENSGSSPGVVVGPGGSWVLCSSGLLEKMRMSSK